MSRDQSRSLWSSVNCRTRRLLHRMYSIRKEILASFGTARISKVMSLAIVVVVIVVSGSVVPRRTTAIVVSLQEGF